MKTRTLVLLALASLFVASIASAQPGPPPWAGRGPGMGILRHAEALGLSEAQKTQLEALQTELKTGFDAARQEIQRVHEELAALRASETPAWDRLAELKAAKFEAHAKMRALRQEAHGRVLSLLTPEQQAKLWALRGQRAGKGWGRGGRGRRGMGGPGMGGPGMGGPGMGGPGGGPCMGGPGMGPGWGPPPADDDL